MPHVDVTATLDPCAGIARDVQVIAPEGVDRPLWTVAVDVGIGDRRDDEAPLDITWVGAAGLRRAGTMVRAAGESIERVALSMEGDMLVDKAMPWAPRGASWASGAESDDAPSYHAVTLAEGVRAPTRVPASAVDYPPVGESSFVDPGPSGTAAGLGHAMALQSAAKETVERDAAMRAWYEPRRAHRIPARVWHGAAPEVQRVVDALGSEGVDVSCFTLDAAGDVQVLLALAIDHANGVVGAGLGLEPLASQSVVRAVQEALQIRTLLIDLRRYGDTAQVRFPIEREIDRARYWSGPEAVPTALQWVQQTDEFRGPSLRTGGVNDWVSLLDTYTFIDLTERLPEKIRELGWSVVRLFSPTLQPLRMSEALGWNLAQKIITIAPHPYI
ncbi:YcaO-like family protein [Nesterenkonia halobia]|uniref:YcaO domain-containing protein n=1 Tax=Nesterenkonia halobia TaxID=37922 RepID=A0ABP6RD46_9MICC